MATQTATLTAADATALQNALAATSRAIGQASVGGPGRNLAITVVTDTAGTLTFNIPAHGGDAVQALAISCSVA